jgi:hypothetical protein
VWVGRGMKGVIGVGVGVGTKRACGNRAVDIQHGTDLEGSAYPCTQGYPSKGFFLF